MESSDLATVWVIGILAVMCVLIAFAHAWRDRKIGHNPDQKPWFEWDRRGDDNG